MTAPTGKPASPGPNPLVWIAVLVAVGALAFLGWRSNQAPTGATAAPAQAAPANEAPAAPPPASDLPAGVQAG